MKNKTADNSEAETNDLHVPVLLRKQEAIPNAANLDDVAAAPMPTMEDVYRAREIVSTLLNDPDAIRQFANALDLLDDSFNASLFYNLSWHTGDVCSAEDLYNAALNIVRKQRIHEDASESKK